MSGVDCREGFFEALESPEQLVRLPASHGSSSTEPSQDLRTEYIYKPGHLGFPVRLLAAVASGATSMV